MSSFMHGEYLGAEVPVIDPTTPVSPNLDAASQTKYLQAFLIRQVMNAAPSTYSYGLLQLRQLTGTWVVKQDVAKTMTEFNNDHYESFYTAMYRLNYDPGTFVFFPMNKLDNVQWIYITEDKSGVNDWTKWTWYNARKLKVDFKDWPTYRNTIEIKTDALEYLRLLLLAPATGLFPTDEPCNVLNYQNMKPPSPLLPQEMRYNPWTGTAADQWFRDHMGGRGGAGSTRDQIAPLARGDGFGTLGMYTGFNPYYVQDLIWYLFHYYEKLSVEAVKQSFNILDMAKTDAQNWIEASYNTLKNGMQEYLYQALGMTETITVKVGESVIHSRTYGFNNARVKAESGDAAYDPSDNLFGNVEFDVSKPEIRALMRGIGMKTDVPMKDKNGNVITTLSACDVIEAQWESVAWLITANMYKLAGKLSFLQDKASTYKTGIDETETRLGKAFRYDPWSNPFLLFDYEKSMLEQQNVFTHVEVVDNPVLAEELKVPVIDNTVPLKNMLDAPRIDKLMSRNITLASGLKVSGFDLNKDAGSDSSLWLLAALGAGAALYFTMKG